MSDSLKLHRAFNIDARGWILDLSMYGGDDFLTNYGVLVDWSDPSSPQLRTSEMNRSRPPPHSESIRWKYPLDDKSKAWIIFMILLYPLSYNRMCKYPFWEKETDMAISTVKENICHYYGWDCEKVHAYRFIGGGEETMIEPLESFLMEGEFPSFSDYHHGTVFCNFNKMIRTGEFQKRMIYGTLKNIFMNISDDGIYFKESRLEEMQNYSKLQPSHHRQSKQYNLQRLALYYLGKFNQSTPPNIERRNGAFINNQIETRKLFPLFSGYASEQPSGGIIEDISGVPYFCTISIATIYASERPSSYLEALKFEADWFITPSKFMNWLDSRPLYEK